MDHAQRILVKVTLASLRRDPDAWSVDQFKATHPGLGIEVWIANSYYGLKIRGPGVSTPEEAAVFTGWLQPWRRATMKAVREIGAHEVRRRYALHYPDNPLGIDSSEAAA